MLRFHRVQSRQSENRWRLDRPYCGGNCCNIPCLVDAATLCAVVPAAMLVIIRVVSVIEIWTKPPHRSGRQRVLASSRRCFAPGRLLRGYGDFARAMKVSRCQRQFPTIAAMLSVPFRAVLFKWPPMGAPVLDQAGNL
jgi:hypothetical protein